MTNSHQLEKLPKGPVSNLPPTIPLVAGAPNLCASNPSDISKLVEAINKIPANSLYALIGIIYGHGMMNIRNTNLGGFMLNRTINALKRRYGGDRYIAMITCFHTMTTSSYEDTKAATAGKAFLPKSQEAHDKMQANGIKLLEDMRKGMVIHMMTGKDREERTSIGGFSQREMNVINNVITLLMHGDKLTATDLRDKTLGLTT